MLGNCGCNPCNPNECTARKEDCSNIVSFSNLLNLPANFSPSLSSGWQNLRIFIKPHLRCILEPCIVKDAHLVFTDPCDETHDLQKIIGDVKQARVFGSIEYNISAQYTTSDQSGDAAIVSDFYTLQVDRVVKYLDDHSVNGCSVIVNDQNLKFDDPIAYSYGNSYALRVKGEFVLHLGYFYNGSFEHAFAGWTQNISPGATADTVMEFEGHLPIDGCYFGLMKAVTPGSYCSIQQEFYANAGDKIYAWSFSNADEHKTLNDNCNVKIRSGNAVLNIPFSSSVMAVGNDEKAPWVKWELTVPETGAHTIIAEISNPLDSDSDSYLGVDAVRLIQDP